MGRTLHYQVLNQDRLTDEHLETVLLVSRAYNTGPLADIWTCENFFLDPLDCFPNREVGHTRQSYERRSLELAASGLSPLNVRRQLLAEGVAKRFSDKIAGFTKVGGNEANARLVYLALCMITELTPARIALSDEGEFLLADLILKGGKARIDPRALKAAWRYWEQQGFLADDQYNCRTRMQAQQALLKKYGSRYQDPEALCREVDPADFADHPEYNAAEIMSGFRGEYWGLNGDFNPFDESMHAIARIKEQLPEGMTMEVAKKKLP